MNDLQVFEFQSNHIRTNVEGEEPWIVALDLARALGYSEESNPSRIFANVPDEWKGVKQIHTLGGSQNLLCLSEQGLYFFLGRSDKPAALPFQKWIAWTVLPSIRRTGSYSLRSTFPTAEILRQLQDIYGCHGAARRVDFLIGYKERTHHSDFLCRNKLAQLPMTLEEGLDRIARVPWWPCSHRTLALYLEITHVIPGRFAERLGIDSSKGFSREDAEVIWRAVYTARKSVGR